MMIISDLRYAVRSMSRKPGFAVLTTLVMAAGLGMSVYLFSFLNTAIFKPLSFEDGGSLVQISGSQDGARSIDPIDLHDYYEIRTSLGGLSEFGAYRNVSLNVSGPAGARRYSGVAAEPNIFRLTRTKPILGRGFTVADNRVGAENVVVIGYDAWQNQLGGDPGVIDRTVRVNGESHRIIGIMPEGYLFPATAEMWVPLREHATRLARGNGGEVYGLAHLDEGVSKQDVNRELALIMQRIEERYPITNTGVGAYVESIPLTGIQDSAPVIHSLQIIVFLIFILASINVGSLLLSRAIERGKETAIRVALGAPRVRLISQMLWESVIVCILGGIIGLFVLAWGLEVTERTFATINPDRPVFWWNFGVDSYTVKATVLFVLTAILVTGLLPAWRNSGRDFNAVLRDGTRGAVGRKVGRLNRVLITSEIFIAMTVLIVVGIMAITNYEATRADYGADPNDILTAQLLLTGPNYDTAEEKGQFVETLQYNLEGSQGISDVMFSSALPGSVTSMPQVALEGYEYPEERGYPNANYVVVMPGTLAKLGIELKSGRYLNQSDDGLEERTVVVTDSFVARHFSKASPLGKRIRLVDSDSDEQEWLTIVGVVEHTVQGFPAEGIGDTPSIFRPYTQAPSDQITVAIRSRSDLAAITRTLRATVASIDPELPAFRIEPYTESIARLLTPLRFATTLFLLFGAVAAVLASTGIYGVMSNTLSQRTQEIGVKRALGATERRITTEYLVKWFKQLLWGGTLGLVAGSAMAIAIEAETDDLFLTVMALISMIGGAVMLATYVPMRRALQMHPSEALRYE